MKSDTAGPQRLCGFSLLAVLAMLCAPANVLSVQPAPAGFHHIHVNAVDPAAAIAWYLKTFPVTSRATVSGIDGLATEKVHVLFSRVAQPPVSTLDTAIWHFGWGSPDVAGDYAMHQANGVTFDGPLSKLASGTLVSYLKGPDNALIEVNSSTGRAFGHVHLLAEHPQCAADWYTRHLGAGVRGTPRTGPCEAPYAAPSEPMAVIRAPAATVRFDDINLIIYPRQRPGPLVSSAGHVVDHIALSVTDLAATVTRLASEGVRVLRGAQSFGSGPGKAALIEGPDSIVIELVEQP